MHENRKIPVFTGKNARSDRSPLPHAPALAPNVGELPTSLTFFLSTDERQLVLKKLKRFKGDRRTALLCALRIDISAEAFQQEVSRG